MFSPLSTLPDEEQVRFRLLARHFTRMRRQLRYVDYRQVERDCEVLAERLQASCSPAHLSETAFVAIPRGGLIVLGILAYWLDLDADQLGSGPWAVGRPVCLVDDCALTGLRFYRALARTPGGSVVFAHLYSPRVVREAIMHREPRVRQCLAARDLEPFQEGDRGLLGERRGRALARLADQLGTEARYALEATDVIAFPWNEPDLSVTDPISGRVEHGWRFVTPSRCLKNRGALGLPLHGDCSRAWVVPDAVVWGRFGEVIWLVKPIEMQAYRLDGIEADMWRALAGYGDVEAVLDFLEGHHEEERQDLAGRLDGFLETLRVEGLIRPGG